MNFRYRISLWLLLALGLVSPHASASTYWNQGVRSKTVTVCFVGSPKASRVTQIQEYVRQFEYAVNVRFDFQGACPAPTMQPDGKPNYAVDIRILIPQAVMVGGQDLFFQANIPGQGCTNKNDPNNLGGSWSNPPNDLNLPEKRACLYNMHLGDDADPGTRIPWLNHTLHEFGHALGLVHEHERADACCFYPNADPRWITNQYMTPYDPRSVMHYTFELARGATCGVNGNYANTGFSDWDRLGLHILYPEDVRVAEFTGTTVLRTTDTLRLQSAWKARGANLAFVARDFEWRLASASPLNPLNLPVSTTPDLTLSLTNAGDYKLEFTYQDFLGRSYSYVGTIRALEPGNYIQTIAAPLAARLPLL